MESPDNRPSWLMTPTVYTVGVCPVFLSSHRSAQFAGEDNCLRRREVGMDSQTVLLIVAYFVAGWLLGGFAFAAPDIIKSLRHRQTNRQTRDRL